MTMESKSAPKALFWIGWIVSVLPALFLIFGGVMSLVNPPAAGEGLAKYGYAENVGVPLGAVLLISTLLYLFPRTAVLGAILLTGYLGGAVATHVRAGEGAFFILFPVAFGAVIWLGLVLREPRLRSLVPWRS
jgi:hypothetical protein